MEKELLQHLQNLCRHSTEIEFTIPSVLFANYDIEPRITKEVQEATEYFKQNNNFKTFINKDIKYAKVKVKIKVKQWESQ